MKTIQFFFILILITGCTSSKKVINNASDSHSQKTIKPVASITDKSNTHKNIQNTPAPTESGILTEKRDTIHSYTSKGFNHEQWHKLLIKHVSDSGKVNYKGFMDDRKALSNYISMLGENLPNSTCNKNETLSFWINAYNAMTIDLILRHYPLKSIKDIKKPWDQRYWKLGKKWYNLNDIEHNILRKMNEPRIHFAIVCASYSCPKLQNKAYTYQNLDEQLTKVTQEFLNNSSKNNISENNLELSKIFQWFAKDFKQHGSLIIFLNQYSDVDISLNAKKHFKDYNWNLNE